MDFINENRIVNKEEIEAELQSLLDSGEEVLWLTSPMLKLENEQFLVEKILKVGGGAGLVLLLLSILLWYLDSYLHIKILDAFMLVLVAAVFLGVLAWIWSLVSKEGAEEEEVFYALTNQRVRRIGLGGALESTEVLNNNEINLFECLRENEDGLSIQFNNKDFNFANIPDEEAYSICQILYGKIRKRGSPSKVENALFVFSGNNNLAYTYGMPLQENGKKNKLVLEGKIEGFWLKIKVVEMFPLKDFSIEIKCPNPKDNSLLIVKGMGEEGNLIDSNNPGFIDAILFPEIQEFLEIQSDIGVHEIQFGNQEKLIEKTSFKPKISKEDDSVLDAHLITSTELELENPTAYYDEGRISNLLFILDVIGDYDEEELGANLANLIELHVQLAKKIKKYNEQ